MRDDGSRRITTAETGGILSQSALPRVGVSVAARSPFVGVYTQLQQGQRWLQQHRERCPIFACVLGFTATGLVPGISAAGATPADRQFTAIADAEFLIRGPQPQPQYPLPPLHMGASPVL